MFFLCGSSSGDRCVATCGILQLVSIHVLPTFFHLLTHHLHRDILQYVLQFRDLPSRRK
ncbi:hypothetical protein Hanom_Chr11g01058991 [Helianthus anomalus]